MQDKLRRFKAGIFQALAHPTRIAIIELLRDEGDVPVTTVYERLGLEQPNASQHLAVLRAKHLVVARKVGNQVLYSLRERIAGIAQGHGGGRDRTPSKDHGKKPASRSRAVKCIPRHAELQGTDMIGFLGVLFLLAAIGGFGSYWISWE